jgi:two-component system, response regulator RegA
MADNPTLLLVDDDERFRARLAKAFAARGFEVRTVASYEEAVQAANEESPEFAVVDLKMPDRSGLELIKALKELEPATNIVVLTGYGSIATALDAVHLGATHYLTKPADVDEIIVGFSRGKPGAVEVSQEIVVPTLARAEWEHIHRVLLSCHGNISQAAKLLGLHRRSLQRKLTKHPIDL